MAAGRIASTRGGSACVEGVFSGILPIDLKFGRTCAREGGPACIFRALGKNFVPEGLWRRVLWHFCMESAVVPGEGTGSRGGSAKYCHIWRKRRGCRSGPREKRRGRGELWRAVSGNMPAGGRPMEERRRACGGMPPCARTRSAGAFRAHAQGRRDEVSRARVRQILPAPARRAGETEFAALVCVRYSLRLRAGPGRRNLPLSCASDTPCASAQGGRDGVAAPLCVRYSLHPRAGPGRRFRGRRPAGANRASRAKNRSRRLPAPGEVTAPCAHPSRFLRRGPCVRTRRGRTRSDRRRPAGD